MSKLDEWLPDRNGKESVSEKKTIEQWLPDGIRKQYIRKFLAVVVVFSAIVLLLGIYTQMTVATELTENRNEQLAASADLTAENINKWMSGKESQALALSNDPAIAASDPNLQKVKNAIEIEVMLRDDLVAIHFIDTQDGTILESTENELKNTTLESRNITWKSGIQGAGLEGLTRDTAGRHEIYTVGNRSLIGFTSATSSYGHAIIMEYDIDERSDGFRNTIDGETTQIVSASGTVLFPSNESKALEPYSDGDTNITEIHQDLNGTNGVFQHGENVVAYAPVAGMDWVVVKQVPKENAYALKQTVQTDLIVLILAAVTGLGGLALFVSRDIIPRITAVSDAASEIANGNLNVAIEDEGRIDEIGQVRDSFREINEYLGTVASQADALARQDFDDTSLESDVPGELGESLKTMRTDLQESIEEIEAAREQAQASKQEAQALSDSLQQQANEFSTVMAEAADGDLTQRLDEDADDEAMRAIAAAANEMLEELQATLQEVRSFAEDVDTSAREVATSAQEVRRVSEDVSGSVQEIADGSDRQDQTIQQASEELTNLSATIEEVASSAEEVATQSQQAAELGETGREYGSDALEEMDAVETKADATIDEVEELEAAMTEIGEIVELIDEIAEQTNMLALNASIEAARAGEAGEGFAVVADEIKSLAAETGEATQDIDRRIQEIQTTTEDAVSDMREVGDSVTDGIEAVEDTVQLLDQLVEQVEEANTGIQSINDATDDQANSTEQVVAMMDEVGSISEETAREAESVSAAAEEQTASITEVAELIQGLSDRSTGLRDAVEQFQLDAAESHSDSRTPGDTAAADGGSPD
ncbi:methyl-accepting chemotaxis protein [Halorhabdus rudnickae]|uniref:methyl-accepting chemotaxis protein n=1 Tax=Halorhabdus rudnickae TaxID=1775544 RepID=UPI001438694A|nr:methyl-accepting chemotaxis protein [Halorhabdus rudnickae]